MFKVTISAIINSITPMRKIANLTMDGRGAIRVARLIREVEKESLSFEKAQQDLLKKYGRTVDNQIVIDKSQLDVYNEEIQKILDEAVEINAEPLDIELIEKVELTPLEADCLMSFIKE